MQVNECYLLPRDRQLDGAEAHCEICGAELYEGDLAYFDEGARLYFCDACLECWAKANLSEVIVGDDY